MWLGTLSTDNPRTVMDAEGGIAGGLANCMINWQTWCESPSKDYRDKRYRRISWIWIIVVKWIIDTSISKLGHATTFACVLLVLVLTLIMNKKDSFHPWKIYPKYPSQSIEPSHPIDDSVGEGQGIRIDFMRDGPT